MTLTKLSDACELITKGTTPTSVGLDFSNSGVPFIRAQNLTNGMVDPSIEPLFISRATHSKLARSVIRPGDVLISIAGTIGRVSLVPRDLPEMNCNQAVAILRPKDGLNPAYLARWLGGRAAASQIDKGKVTATISNLSLSQIGSLHIRIPPIAEQGRIAAILDQAEALRRLRSHSIECLHQLAEGIFRELFGDLPANSKKWKRGVLGDVSEIVSGITKGRKADGQTRLIPYMAVVNVQDKSLNLEVVKTIEATETEIRRYRLLRDDLLLTEGGDPDKLGRGTLWNEDLPEAIHQNHIFRVRITSNQIEPVFLNWLISSQYGKSYFLRSAKQTTGIASINMSQLRAFPVLLPPIEVQREFRQRLDRHREVVAAAKSYQVELDHLFVSLQQRAFNGELTSAASATEMRKIANAI